MDIFVEQLVKKKFDPQDYLISAGIILLGIVLVFLSIIFLPPLAILVLAAVCYGAYYLITSRSVEFEYSVTNGDITIDKIIYRRKRKRVISVDAHSIEEMGLYDPQKQAGKTYQKRLMVSGEGREAGGEWYFCARDAKVGTMLVVFSPEEKILQAMRPFLPGQVSRDAFNRH